MSKSKATGICYNCGADNGLHQSYTNRCPKDGIEEWREEKKQKWQETTFEDAGIKNFELLATSMHENLVDALKSVKEYHGDALLPVLKLAIDSLLKQAEQKV